jgi:hypothetical protein
MPAKPPEEARHDAPARSAQEPPRYSAPVPHAAEPSVPEAKADVVVMTVAHPGPPIPDPIPPVPAVTEEPVAMPEVPVPVVSVHAAPDAPPVTPAPALVEAFQMLCAALLPCLVHDAAAYQHCQLIQGWHGPSVANQHVAWSHAMQLLGRVLDKKIET